MRLQLNQMSYERWCRFNNLDASELDTNYIKYLEWKEEQCKTHQLSK